MSNDKIKHKVTLEFPNFDQNCQNSNGSSGHQDLSLKVGKNH